MREILFCGKRINDGKWIEGHYVITPKFDGSRTAIITADSPRVLFYVEAETVGQYIGRTDKNGTKIFTGNIVKADDFMFVVKFGKCGGVANAENYGYMGFYFEAFGEGTKAAAKYGLRDDICYFTDVEVIGNIHDNPELWKGDKSDA
jgi:uncharacterized phage protein (TIGR01671 family)